VSTTRRVRSPWERPGGTSFYFVNDGIESALQQAREAAGDKDIRIAGGANAIQSWPVP
jgi:dihydrofolate reductase